MVYPGSGPGWPPKTLKGCGMDNTWITQDIRGLSESILSLEVFVVLRKILIHELVEFT
jgi:hypothetical protein